LQHSILPDDRARSVIEVVQRELLTPFGLRTLAPGDPQYRGRPESDIARRASAHQGSVWPWLLGAFVSAYIKVNHGSEVAREQALEWLSPLWDYLSGEIDGQQLPETFDGDFPHTPRGRVAHRWTVAEVRRAMTEAALRPENAGRMVLLPRTMAATNG
jgi:glycogen debranching enzyme